MVLDKFGRAHRFSKGDGMNVDKFGRHIGVSDGVRKPPGFYLTSEGNFDMDGKIIHNLGEPSSLSDAVTIRYLGSNAITSGADTHYSAKNQLIRNVQSPILLEDVATRGFVENVSINKNTSSGHFNAQNKRIESLAAPVAPTDAATMEYVTRVSIGKTSEGDFNLNNKRLRNMDDPLLPTDAVNVRYVSKNLPKVYDNYWDFGNKRLSNVKDPHYDGEVVTLRYLKKMIPELKITSGNHFNASNLKMENLADGTEESDAANIRVVRREIERLSYERDRKMQRLETTLLNHIHAHTT